MFESSAFGHYQGRIREDLIWLVKEVAKLLPEHRLNFGSVFKNYHQVSFAEKGVIADPDFNHDADAYGTIMLFDASAYRDSTDNTPPFLQSFRLRKMELKREAEIKSLLNDPNQFVFEIGRFSIQMPTEASSDLATRVKDILELYVLRYFAERFPDNFFVHAGSAAHVTLYKRQYALNLRSFCPLEAWHGIRNHSHGARERTRTKASRSPQAQRAFTISSIACQQTRSYFSDAFLSRKAAAVRHNPKIRTMHLLNNRFNIRRLLIKAPTNRLQ